MALNLYCLSHWFLWDTKNKTKQKTNKLPSQKNALRWVHNIISTQFGGFTVLSKPCRKLLLPGAKNPWFSGQEFDKFSFSSSSIPTARVPRHLGNPGLKDRRQYWREALIYLPRTDLSRVRLQFMTPSARSVDFSDCLSLGDRAPLASQAPVYVRRWPTEINGQTGSHDPADHITWKLRQGQVLTPYE